MEIGSPASTPTIVGATKCILISMSLERTGAPTATFFALYCTSVKPLRLRKSSAKYWAAKQRLGIFPSLIVVVSRGASSGIGVAGLTPQASSRAIPAAARPNPPTIFKKSRRLNRSTLLDGRRFIVVLLSSLQLHLEFVKQTPVCALLDNLIWVALDKPSITET